LIGELAAAIEHIKSRASRGMTLLCDLLQYLRRIWIRGGMHPEPPRIQLGVRMRANHHFLGTGNGIVHGSFLAGFLYGRATLDEGSNEGANLASFSRSCA
jgi:hypothetical protein